MSNAPSPSQVLGELVDTCRTHDFTDIVSVHEVRGEPDNLVVCHLPYGPTAFFSIFNTVRITCDTTLVFMTLALEPVHVTVRHSPVVAFRAFVRGRWESPDKRRCASCHQDPISFLVLHLTPVSTLWVAFVVAGMAWRTSRTA